MPTQSHVKYDFCHQGSTLADSRGHGRVALGRIGRQIAADIDIAHFFNIHGFFVQQSSHADPADGLAAQDPPERWATVWGGGTMVAQDLKEFSTMVHGGADLAPYHDTESKIPDDVKALVAQKKADIISGVFRVDINEAAPPSGQ